MSLDGSRRAIMDRTRLTRRGDRSTIERLFRRRGESCRSLDLHISDLKTLMPLVEIESGLFYPYTIIVYHFDRLLPFPMPINFSFSLFYLSISISIVTVFVNVIVAITDHGTHKLLTHDIPMRILE